MPCIARLIHSSESSVRVETLPFFINKMRLFVFLPSVPAITAEHHQFWALVFPAFLFVRLVCAIEWIGPAIHSARQVCWTTLYLLRKLTCKLIKKICLDTLTQTYHRDVLPKYRSYAKHRLLACTHIREGPSFFLVMFYLHLHLFLLCIVCDTNCIKNTLSFISCTLSFRS